MKQNINSNQGVKSVTDMQANKNHSVIDAILRMPEVLKLTGLSKATIYRMMKEGTFPRQYRLSERAVGWKESALCAWTENREVAA